MLENEFLKMYNKSVLELIKLIEKENKRPNEKDWNIYAIDNGLLLSHTIGYISGEGFNKFCRELIKTKCKKNK